MMRLRKAIGLAVFPAPPSGPDITRMLDKGIRRARRKPRHIITDKGSQFFPVRAKPEHRHRHPFLAWCRRRKIRPRFGAVGKYGSIAIVERLIRMMKTECTRRILVPLDINEMRCELAVYATWYNEFRPHSSLHARTPQEVYDGVRAPPALRVIPQSQSLELQLRVGYFEARRHLPVIELKRAA